MLVLLARKYRKNNGVIIIKKSGFTIIEVVLVLAVTGLIFSIVFLALPQMSKSRRDTQRKRNADQLIAAIETYASNSRGVYPVDAAAVNADVVGTYLLSGGSDWQDPENGAYSIVSVSTSSTADVDQIGEIGYLSGSKCSSSPTALDYLDSAPAILSVAIVMYLETGGLYCRDNN